MKKTILSILAVAALIAIVFGVISYFEEKVRKQDAKLSWIENDATPQDIGHADDYVKSKFGEKVFQDNIQYIGNEYGCDTMVKNILSKKIDTYKVFKYSYNNPIIFGPNISNSTVAQDVNLNICFDKNWNYIRLQHREKDDVLPDCNIINCDFKVSYDDVKKIIFENDPQAKSAYKVDPSFDFLNVKPHWNVSYDIPKEATETRCLNDGTGGEMYSRYIEIDPVTGKIVTQKDHCGRVMPS